MPYIFCYLGLTANLLICYFIFIFCRINNISRQPKKHFVTVLCKSILFVSAKAPAPAYQLLIMARQQPKLEPDLLASTGLQGISLIDISAAAGPLAFAHMENGLIRRNYS